MALVTGCGVARAWRHRPILPGNASSRVGDMPAATRGQRPRQPSQARRRRALSFRSASGPLGCLGGLWGPLGLLMRGYEIVLQAVDPLPQRVRRGALAGDRSLGDGRRAWRHRTPCWSPIRDGDRSVQAGGQIGDGGESLIGASAWAAVLARSEVSACSRKADTAATAVSNAARPRAVRPVPLPAPLPALSPASVGAP
jgi:hypothetical protein